jgi:hypothetical protein
MGMRSAFSVFDVRANTFVAGPGRPCSDCSRGANDAATGRRRELLVSGFDEFAEAAPNAERRPFFQ